MTKMSCDTDLFAAIETADVLTVSQCLKQGADPNAVTQNGWTPLMLAILHGYSAMTDLLLEQGADPNLTTQSQENSSRTALSVAVSNGRLDAVQLLVSHNADVDARDTQGMTALDLARKLVLRPLHQAKMTEIVSFLQDLSNRPMRQPLEPAAV